MKGSKKVFEILIKLLPGSVKRQDPTATIGRDLRVSFLTQTSGVLQKPIDEQTHEQTYKQTHEQGNPSLLLPSHGKRGAVPET